MNIKTAAVKPPQVLVAGYTLIILLGAFLLKQPYASAHGEPLRFIDALFTATSAACVTGLMVADTGDFSVFGQIVLLILIQTGGIGFMTMATAFALLMKKRITLKEKLILQQSMNQHSLEGIIRLTRKVLFYALTIEAAAAVLFAIRWSFDMPVGQAVYYGVLHAVSLFNNAGFGWFGDEVSLSRYVGDWLVNVVAMTLTVLGGLGFVVLSDLAEYPRRRRLTLHSKTVLAASGGLILVGAAVVLLFEGGNADTLGPLNGSGKLLAAFFHSISARTSGYHTVPLAEMQQTTQLFLILLMFIGASPGSTGGGIKTTTFMTLIGSVISMVRGREDVVLFQFRLGKERIYHALTITMSAIFFVVGVTMLLSTTEDHHFMMILFETTSAFGTVGLSLGLTPDLTDFGKMVILLTMFAGRVGLLTLVIALGPKPSKELFRYPEGKMMIG